MTSEYGISRRLPGYPKKMVEEIPGITPYRPLSDASNAVVQAALSVTRERQILVRVARLTTLLRHRRRSRKND